MTLALDVEGLTDEQKAEIEAKVQAEIDRRVTGAVQTTTQKLTGELTQQMQSEYEAKMQQAIEAAKMDASMTEEQRINELQKQMERQQNEFKRTQMTYEAQRKLEKAGLDETAIATLTPIIVAGASDMDALSTTLDAFVQTQEAAVSAALTKQKEQLASNVTPPSSTGGRHVPPSPDQAVAAILSDESLDPRHAEAAAINLLLSQSADAGV